MKNTQKKAELLDEFVAEILNGGIESDRENTLVKRYRDIHSTSAQKRANNTMKR